MNKRAFITICLAAMMLSAGVALSASVSDGIIAQLTRQGFTDISSETTWLGRVRILATRKDGSREIVINPRTGEILRDQFTASNGSIGAEPILDEVGGSTGAALPSSDGGGSGSNGSGDDAAGNDGSGGQGSGGGSGGGGSGSGSGGGGKGSGGDGGDDKGKDN